MILGFVSWFIFLRLYVVRRGHGLMGRGPRPILEVRTVCRNIPGILTVQIVRSIA